MTKPERKTRRRSVWMGALGATLAAALMIGACGGDDEQAGDDELPSTTAEDQATTTTEPPGTESAAVEPIVVDLLARLDAVTTEIVGDPGAVVNNPDSPTLAELEEIFAPGEAYDAMLSTFRRNADAGLTLEPLNSDDVATTTLTGRLVTIDEETVEGLLCVKNTYRAREPGGYGEVKDGVAHPGRVTAVRIDGVWLIEQVDEDDSQVCDPEASA